jgi:glycosyltransferase involved in cell wall biosynthesis
VPALAVPPAPLEDLSTKTHPASGPGVLAGPGPGVLAGPGPSVLAGPGPGVLAGPGGTVPRPIVLAVGRLAPQKGFATLLAAAVRWRDLGPEPLLAIVGEGPLEAQLRRQAAELGLTVQFAGSRPDVPALLASAAVFVLPSLWEGQPLIVQEALRAGVPIVATRAGGTPELTGEDAALLVPPGDPDRLAAAVRSVLTDPALAARLREAALQRARWLPSEDGALAAALAEYRQVAGKGS